jgi:hypothetical protein
MAVKCTVLASAAANVPTLQVCITQALFDTNSTVHRNNIFPPAEAVTTEWVPANAGDQAIL